jgi:glycosyltransferase involved in cell wall biosynthesis
MMSSKDLSQHKISIIIPAYNAARFLEATIESVLAQTLSTWELIIVDDGSQDGTVQIAKRYMDRDPRILLVTQPNAGPSAARNYGFIQADPRSEWIIFLDADDTWEAEALEILVTALSDHPAALAANGVARYMDQAGNLVDSEFMVEHQRQRWGIRGNRIVPWPPDQSTTFAVEALMERIMTSGTVLIRRSALEAAGLWDPGLRMWEDWDLWLRLCLQGEITFVDRFVLRYRRHDANLSNQADALNRGERHIRERLMADLRDDPERFAIARAGFHRQRQCLALQFWTLAKAAWHRRKPVHALKQTRYALLHYLAFLRDSAALRRG